MTRRRALLIAGPTASGKSALALRLAEALQDQGGAAIVNADSMQVYRDLRILTARPTAADEARAPHHLYGFRDADAPCSAGQWAALAAAAIDEICAQGRLPIVVGGAGLYFRALTEGMAPIPDIDPEIRASARQLMSELGPAAFHARLSEIDPVTAGRLRPTDPQRLVRAWEVFAQTGAPLSEWHARPAAPPPFTGELIRVALVPPRELVYARCDARLDAMLAARVLDEVAALDRLVGEGGYAPDLPILGAVGLAALRAHLQGELSAAAALYSAKASTRQYAKRQSTWIRNQMIAWINLDTQDPESLFQEIFALIIKSDLTD